MVLKRVAIILGIQGLVLTHIFILSAAVYKPFKCGTYKKSSRSPRVIGGTDCFEGEFPWMVSFKSKSNDKHFCGGFVISEKHVLSAAHCFYNNEHGPVNQANISATIGEFNLYTPEKIKDVTIPLEEIIIHPNYNRIRKDNDIALVKLKESVKIHPKVEPLCLPSLKIKPTTTTPQSRYQYRNSPYSKAIVAGWGQTVYNQSNQEWMSRVDSLKKSEVNIWETDKCRNVYEGFKGFPSNKFICAGAFGRNGCDGDSGGPLMLLEGSKWVAIGVVSVGNRCGSKGRPDVYTDVSQFVPWIKENLS